VICLFQVTIIRIPARFATINRLTCEAQCEDDFQRAKSAVFLAWHTQCRRIVFAFSAPAQACTSPEGFCLFLGPRPFLVLVVLPSADRDALEGSESTREASELKAAAGAWPAAFTFCSPPLKLPSVQAVAPTPPEQGWGDLVGPW